jgi:quinol monooxygenase YgiN
MFMRLVQMRVNPNKIFEYVKLYGSVIIPTLQHTPGCLYAGLVQSLEDQDDGISITFWRSQDDALAYERSGKYAQALEVSRPFFSDSTEWRVQLSVDLRLELWPVASEPVVKSYATEVSVLKGSGLPGEGAGSMYLRIFSMKLDPEKKHDLAPVLDAVTQTEALVLATPVYFGDGTSLFKGFIYLFFSSRHLSPRTTIDNGYIFGAEAEGSP